MIRALILLTLAACATSHHAEQRVKSDDVSAATASEAVDVVQHVEDAPDRTTTTVEEYAPPLAETAPAPGAAPTAPRPPPAPVLVKRTVKVEEHGAVVTDTHVEAQGAQTKHEEAKVLEQAKTDSTFRPAGIFGGLLAMWPLLVLGGLAVAGVAGWRLLRARVPKL